ncbi:MAG: hydroxyacid dehydrogenase, partial [Planctomycetes bacterium]|nr:hydroxyacid dehydrogenase [Planctomycetota bacterium]
MNVLIADKFEQAGIDQLRSLVCTVNTDADLTGDSLRMAVGSNGCEVLIVRSTKVSDDVLAAGSSLKLIIRAGA